MRETDGRINTAVRRGLIDDAELSSDRRLGGVEEFRRVAAVEFNLVVLHANAACHFPLRIQFDRVVKIRRDCIDLGVAPARGTQGRAGGTVRIRIEYVRGSGVGSAE